jgi:hypothetical protein
LSLGSVSIISIQLSWSSQWCFHMSRGHSTWPFNFCLWWSWSSCLVSPTSIFFYISAMILPPASSYLLFLCLSPEGYSIECFVPLTLYFTYPWSFRFIVCISMAPKI